MPERIQLRRTKGWRKPEGATTVARPSRWGNPYRVGQWVADPVNEYNPIAARYEERPSWLAPGRHLRIGITGRRYETYVYQIVTPQQAVDLFRRWWEFEGFDVAPLRGRDLACWCPLDQPCHGDVLLDLANREEGA